MKPSSRVVLNIKFSSSCGQRCEQQTRRQGAVITKGALLMSSKVEGQVETSPEIDDSVPQNDSTTQGKVHPSKYIPGYLVYSSLW